MKTSFLHFSWAVVGISVGLWDFFVVEQANIKVNANDFILLLPAFIAAIGLLCYPLAQKQQGKAEQLLQFLVSFSGFTVVHRMVFMLPLSLGFILRNGLILTIVVAIIIHYWRRQKHLT